MIGDVHVPSGISYEDVVTSVDQVDWRRVMIFRDIPVMLKGRVRGNQVVKSMIVNLETQVYQGNY